MEIVTSVSTKNIAHNTEDQVAGSSQSWQNLHQQQLLGNQLVRNEIKNYIEPSHYLQPYVTKTINDCNSESVNQLLGLPKSDKNYTADHVQLNHRPFATSIYNNINNYQIKISQLHGLKTQLKCLMKTTTQILLSFCSITTMFFNTTSENSRQKLPCQQSCK